MRARHDEPFRVAFILLTLALAPQAEAARAGGGVARANAAAAEEMWLAVAVNGQLTGATVLVRYDHAGQLWVGGDDLRSWRLPLPAQADTSLPGSTLYPLSAYRGLKFRVDESSGTLVVDAPAALFDAVQVDGKASGYRVPDASPPGGFFNYDVVALNETTGFGASALLEGGVFGRFGTVTTRFLERETPPPDETTPTSTPLTSASVRLESTWTLDRPETATSFRLGDSITGASRWWGGAVRFAGFQWGTNFATQPDLVTMPLPSVRGESALPSTMELYVDGALRMRENLPEGPFTVRDVPITSGDGEIRVVVRDLLGREQVITQSYYASARMLRPGLHDYSFEVGAARENFGLVSNDYGRPLFVGTERYGFSDHITGEVHAEVLQDQQTAGLAGSYLIPHFGVVSLSVAGSSSESGVGRLAGFGFDRSAARFSFGLNAEVASAGFRRLGMLEGQAVERVRARVYTNVALGHAGSLSLLGTRQEYDDGTQRNLITVRHSMDVRGIGYLSLAAIRVQGSEKDTIVALGFTRAFGAISSNSGVTSDHRGMSGYTQLQKNMPTASGFGYRMRAYSGLAQGADGGVSYQNAVGTYALEAEQVEGVTRTRASASGGIALMGAGLFPSRRIESSFAIARVGDQAHVRVYRDNQLVGQTNDEGFVILPGLRAYEDNQIRIEQADLPLDVRVDTLFRKAVPRYRSGVLLSFPIERSRGALLTVLLENGQPLPAGTEVTNAGIDGTYPTGLRGEVYVDQLADKNRLRATLPNGACEFDVAYTPSEDPLPKLGPFECRVTGR